MNNTRTSIAVLTGALFAAVAATAQLPESPDNGQLSEQDGQVFAWSAPREAWLEVEAYWLDYAERSDGKFWGRSSDYPPYREVNEYDTFLVELEQGSCLMLFFHGRWRRAEDVRRWDTGFNEQLGCPYVFD